MSVNKNTRPSHVVIRLPADMVAALEARQPDLAARSIAPVVQRVLIDRMLNGDRPTVYRRNPISEEPRSLFLRREVVQLVKGWAKDGGATIADTIFTILAEDLDARRGRRLNA